MFKLIPKTAVPGFRVGRPDDDELGFNVADDGSTPPVLRGAPRRSNRRRQLSLRRDVARLRRTAGTEPQSGCASRHRIATAPGRPSNADDSDGGDRLLAA